MPNRKRVSLEDIGTCNRGKLGSKNHLRSTWSKDTPSLCGYMKVVSRCTTHSGEAVDSYWLADPYIVPIWYTNEVPIREWEALLGLVI